MKGHNLPAETSSFVGRRRELTALLALLGEARLVTLAGAAGVGKTRLALRAAVESLGAFADGVWLVELSGEHNGDLVGHDIAAALGLREQSVRPQVDVLADFLAGREALIVLDTCEHLTDACAALAGRLLEAAPGLRVLATSRQPLGLEEEQVFTLGPLDVPAQGAEDPGGYDAVRLFIERARALAPEADLDPAAAAHVCRLLDGIPLAIELAVRRLRILSPRQLADRLGDRFTLLTGSRVPLGRHQTMRTAIGWSHELCAPAERLLWARLSVFAGSFDLAAVRAVCADGALRDVDTPLAGLVDRSIVVAEGTRFRLLDTVREYGADWLLRLGETAGIGARHRDHYLGLARRADAEWYGPQQVEWSERLDREMPNLRVALDAGLGEPEGLELVGALWVAWICTGHLREGRYYLDRALLLHSEPSRGRTTALWVCGWVAFAQGDLAAARVRSAEAYDTAMLQGDLVIAARARHGTALAAIATGALEVARRFIDEEVELLRQAGGEDIGLPVAEVVSAMLLSIDGKHEAAVAVLDVQSARCAARGELWARSFGAHYRSLAELGMGRVAEAERYARAALRIKWRLGDAAGSAMAMDQLAASVAARGDAEEAARLLGSAQRVWTAFGLPQFGSPHFAEPRAAAERDALAALGADAYRSAYEYGLAAEPETAVARILTRKVPK